MSTKHYHVTVGLVGLSMPETSSGPIAKKAEASDNAHEWKQYLESDGTTKVHGNKRMGYWTEDSKGYSHMEVVIHDCCEAECWDNPDNRGDIQ